jgi:hypothetical protein
MLCHVKALDDFIYHITIERVTEQFQILFFLPNQVCYSSSTVQYNTVQYSTVQYSTVQYSTVQYSTVEYSTVHDSTVHYTTIYMTVQYSTVEYSTVQYSSERGNGDGDCEGEDMVDQATSSLP